MTMKKILIRVLAILVVLILAAGIGIYAVWHNELSTFFSMKQLCVRDDATWTAACMRCM